MGNSFKDNIGNFLYKLGIVLAILSIIGGMYIGYNFGVYYSYGSRGFLTFVGLIFGIIEGTLMLLISGFGKMISDISVIRRNVEEKDGYITTDIKIDSI